MAMKIMVTPEKLESTAGSVEGKAADYERLYRKLFQEVEQLGNNWKGEDNVAFVTQIRGFQDDFRKMKCLMTEYASFLRKSAKAYRVMQKDCVARARKLSN